MTVTLVPPWVVPDDGDTEETWGIVVADALGRMPSAVQPLTIKAIAAATRRSNEDRSIKQPQCSTPECCDSRGDLHSVGENLRSAYGCNR